ncbi:YggS family pyridoxal phosphate-dependent enzyme [Candidatus Odyssella thessalonicensis]|uniref:YggS family pyridoxal phosphate-dependent enzyme n=1 Tax=Candidatus Odyssella thessalonicensis TaxID=84647 RepID=UPI000225C178|nr:YggS family pyridoxal phosphate-dependent enzyme [Candidatus Odyssella thessalonicensis]
MPFPVLNLEDRPDVEVMAASKMQPVASIRQLLDYGHRFFGENRVQEALAKWPALLQEFSDCRLHLIGPLQTNKVKAALQLFHGIEVIDRLTLVDALVKYLKRPTTRTREFLIQINIGEEPQKAGVAPAEFITLYHYCQEKGLPIQGLMCVPPAKQDPTPYFQHMQQLADQVNLKILSMGMSQDYTCAVRYGSTRIRLGTALFGSR